jgi:hypothetical protein
MPLARTRSEIFDGIRIRGGFDFLRRTHEALALLRPTSRFGEIRNNIGLIRQGKRSGMKAWAKEPTFVVGKPTWKHSILWYAGAIAHDAYHSKLYVDAKQVNRGREPDADCWMGAEAERKCLGFQLQVLMELNADPETISYINGCRDNPTYQGHNHGWRSWLDYLKRWW